MRGNKIIESLEHRSRPFWIAAGILCIGLLGIVDYLTGYEVSFSLFYLAPIAAISWFANRNLGLTMSVLSGITWLTAELAAGQDYAHPIIYLWNTMIRFGFFVLVACLVAEVRSAHEVQRLMARTDYVSGAVNARYFNELVEMEIARSRRYQYPFTAAYMDLDDFKQVNDNFGHDTGDEVIRFITSELKSQLRSTDIVARMGGDEFVLLLPTVGQSEAQSVIPRLHYELTQQMQQRNWPVTFSIGVVICVVAPASAKELIKMADELMYMVKNSTKNNFRFLTYTGVQEKNDK
ncbi:MAG TPA: GGDEF domain-containing protein [Anaerolineales bacterium]|nr:GGDEF domain-containing protein [Anaerolineales bacterium]